MYTCLGRVYDGNAEQPQNVDYYRARENASDVRYFLPPRINNFYATQDSQFCAEREKKSQKEKSTRNSIKIGEICIVPRNVGKRGWRDILRREMATIENVAEERMNEWHGKTAEVAVVRWWREGRALLP
ncbi:hypothetical protein ALC53_02581 [Atta colombica]|uniref:Uncharacterized protein n=1 Tax=Atta colombica TaxID=520822 RepID=A0A195BQG9_9HYME|nr:hypothetical protein ALC53_02581 [Atta colombica]